MGSSGIIWNHLDSFGIIWDLGVICDHLGSYVSISAHLWERLGSSRIIWDHLRIHLGSPAGAIWEETSEERHLESFWGGLSQLMRKHHPATACKTPPKSQYRCLFLKLSITKYCKWSGLDATLCPKCTQSTALVHTKRSRSMMNPELWKIHLHEVTPF